MKSNKFLLFELQFIVVNKKIDLNNVTLKK